MEVGDTEGDTRGRLVWLTDAGTSMHSGVAREPDNTYGQWEQIGVMFGRGIPVYQKRSAKEIKNPKGRQNSNRVKSRWLLAHHIGSNYCDH